MSLHSFLARAEGQDTPRRVELGAGGGLALTFTYMPRASFADEDWIGFELKNATGAPVKLTFDNYVMVGEYSRLDGQAMGSGDLASGAAIGAPNVAQNGIPPGTLRNLRTPSLYSASLLGWTEVPIKVNATLIGNVEDADHHVLLKSDYSHPVKFSFIWDPVPAGKLAALRARFEDMLAAPALNQFEEGYVFQALLKAAPVGGQVATDRLIASVRGKPDDINRTTNILEYLASSRGSDKQTLDYFTELLQQGNTDRAGAMLYGLPAWSSDYVLPALDAIEKKPSLLSIQMANVFLWKRASWPADAHIDGRLLKALDARYHFAAGPPPNRYRGDFVQALEALGNLQDKDALPWIKPLLDDCSLIEPGIDYTADGAYPQIQIAGGLPPPIRLCDAALRAAQAIEGVKIQPAAALPPGKRTMLPTRQEMDRQRAEIKKSLR
jgi:hypothetical protein